MRTCLPARTRAGTPSRRPEFFLHPRRFAMARRLLAFLLAFALVHASVPGAWRACLAVAGGDVAAAASHEGSAPHGDHHGLPADGQGGAAGCPMVTACGSATVASAAEPPMPRVEFAKRAVPAFDGRAPSRVAAAPEPPPPRT